MGPQGMMSYSGHGAVHHSGFISLSLADPTAAVSKLRAGVLVVSAARLPPLHLPQPWPLSGTFSPGAHSCPAKINPSFLQLNSRVLLQTLL